MSLPNMSLPTTVTDMLWQISDLTARSLSAKLERIQIDFENDAADSTATHWLHQPSDPKTIADRWQGQTQQEQPLSDRFDESRREALVQKLQQKEFDRRHKQSEQLLERLREWQAKNIKIQLEDLPKRWQQDRCFSQLSQQATRQILRSQAIEPHRFLILTAPLKISKTCPQTFHDDLNIELADELERFFDRYYPPIGHLLMTLSSPVQYYSDYFSEPISKIHIGMIQEILSPIPTVIFYTNINQSEVNCHVAFWTPGHSKILFHPIPSWNWQVAKSALEASGFNPANLLATIRQLAIVIHQVLGGFIADWYYLNVNPFSEPRLFHLEHYFQEKNMESRWIQPYIDCLHRIAAKQMPIVLKEVNPPGYLEKIKSFRYLRTLSGHSSWVDSLAMSRDGKLLVSGSYDNTIKLWDLSTGESLHTLVGHESTVYSVAISSDRNMVVSGSDDGTIKLWNTETAELIRTFRDSDSPRDSATKIQSVVVTDDGKKLVSAGDDRMVKIWELDSGELLHKLRGHSQKVEVVAIAPEGRTIVSGSDDGTIKLWDLDSGTLLRTIDGHFSAIYSLAIGADGETIVTGHGQKQIKIWQLATGQLIRTLYGNFGAVYALAMSPDSKTLATADFLGEHLGKQTVAIQLWDLSAGRVIHTLPEHSHRIFSLCFSPDGNTLISASEDKTIKVWQCD